MKQRPHHHRSLLVSLVLGGLTLSARIPEAISPPSPLEGQESRLEAIALNRAMDQRAALGLNADHGFRSERILATAQGRSLAHLQHFYRGIKVWGSQLVVQMNGQGQVERLADHTQKRIAANVSTAPSLDASQAMSIASQEFGVPSGPSPQSELVIYADRGRRPLRRSGRLNLGVPGIRLAYHVHIATEASGEPRSQDYMIDANSGEVLATWNSLQTAWVQAQGKGFYSGNVTLDVNIREDGTQLLQDTTRPKSPHPLMPFAQPGNLFLDIGHQDDSLFAPFMAWGPIYSNPSGASWGDGTLYNDTGASGDSQTGASLSVAVDAAAATANTWDFYERVFAWKGIDNKESALISRLHVGQQFQNAYWSDQCFCVSYGDGQAGAMAPLVTPDIVAHEMTHGVTTAMGGLDYWWESGGLNEAFSDIFGKLFQVWLKAPGGLQDTIPEGNLDWGLGRVILPSGTVGDPSQFSPFRYLNHPSLDGNSWNWWTPLYEQVDVHYTSGAMNRAFYFLAEGASTNPDRDDYSPFLPGGLTGIGLDKAARILFEARQALTFDASFGDIRTEMLDVASRMYGSVETSAVQNAFAAINVGAPPTSLAITRVNRPEQDWSLGGTVRCNGQLDFTSGNPNTTWSLVEGAAAGALNPDTNDLSHITYLAGSSAGLFHLKAQSGSDSLTFTVTVIQPDMDEDHATGVFDLGLLSYQMGSPGAPNTFDLNGDHVINTFDAELFLASLTQYF